MLEPDARLTLFDSLRPPAGHRLDVAIGTTYSLSLEALMSAPTAFAMHQAIERDDVSDLAPVELLDSIRRHADRITVFCQAGQISVPIRFRLLPYLEDSIVPVRAPLGGVFHPKFWLLRFVETESEAQRYRILVASRNLTHDRSWDTILRLDSTDEPTEGSNYEVLPEFLRALPGMALQPIDPHRLLAIDQMADEIGSIRFSLPPSISSSRLLPLGHQENTDWPFPASCDRLLVISPFLQASLLRALPQAGTQSVLVTRLDALQSVGQVAAERFSEHYVLNTDAVPSDEPASAEESSDSLLLSPDDPANGPSGLHGKVFVIEDKDEVRLFTGSANATRAAFSKNVEILLELRGASRDLGVRAILEENGRGEPTFRSLLVPATPTDGPEITSEESLAALDGLRFAFGALRLSATIRPIDADTYEVHFRSDTPAPTVPDAIQLRCWPITARSVERANPLDAEGHLDATFSLTIEGLTAFLAVELRDTDQATCFVLRAELIDAPSDRRARLLRSLLGDAKRFLRYLLMLLSDDATDGGLVSTIDSRTGDPNSWERDGTHEVPLLETLLRALSRDPDRLVQVERLIGELRSDEEGAKLLPPGLDEVWGPIWEIARERIR